MNPQAVGWYHAEGRPVTRPYDFRLSGGSGSVSAFDAGEVAWHYKENNLSPSCLGNEKT
jgi:hypothetical protein